MKAFMDKDFLLETETAQKLYHEFSAPDVTPIIDYHCHINPKEIWEDRKFENITQVWLGGDHYKWRFMRSCGVDEKYITGNASKVEKFVKGKVEMVQFHQNYSYEDFILGYKPNAEGGFELRHGIFYKFCKKALNTPDKDFFFIIDEINRGNISNGKLKAYSYNSDGTMSLMCYATSQLSFINEETGYSNATNVNEVKYNEFSEVIFEIATNNLVMYYRDTNRVYKTVSIPSKVQRCSLHSSASSISVTRSSI